MTDFYSESILNLEDPPNGKAFEADDHEWLLQVVRSTGHKDGIVEVKFDVEEFFLDDRLSLRRLLTGHREILGFMT